ncbi:MAG: ABC-type transport auxiliary lipoprotein family protein [Candidatus Accumulibacter sp.]|jgi:cholesterol transport system auxiliary component|nr:ABC-type transport auxiliary lipoprotein family protein [Accumulibacter sp.]
MKHPLLAPFALCALFSLSACVGLPEASAPLAQYDFGLPVEGAGSVAAKLGLSVRTPAWFDSLYVDYRLIATAPLERREYATSRWAANPGVLLSRRLRQRMGFSTETSADARTSCVLRVDLNEFSQIFDSSNESHALLEADARLFGGNKLLAQRRFSVKRASSAPDARGGVEALVASVGQFSNELESWLETLKTATPSSGECF